ncbi:MAG: CBS domain-containing protein [Acidothermales bacterium]|nr:CBS domain-containing protein [Acidothermales bacterium]
MTGEAAKAFLKDAAARPAGSYAKITLTALRDLCGYRVRNTESITHMRRLLDEAGLVTDPDFAGADRRTMLTLVPVNASVSAEAEPETEEAPEPEPDEFRFPPVAPTVADIPSARTELVFIARERPASEARDLMFNHGIGQLPVLSDPAICHGMVTWESIAKYTVNNPGATVEQCLEDEESVRLDDNLFDRLPRINAKGAAFVRDSDGVYCGVVTARRVNEYLSRIVEPFYVLGEIERRLRHRLNEVFTAEDFAPYGTSRKPAHSADDLMFGDYCKLLNKRERYARLGWNADWEMFRNRLDEVRRIRNSVMHFNADIIDRPDLNTLYAFSRWLRALHPMH